MIPPYSVRYRMWYEKFVKDNMENNISYYKEKFKELALKMCREMGVKGADIDISFDNQGDVYVNFRF